MNFNLANKLLEECDCEKCCHNGVCKYRKDVMTLKEDIKNLKELKEFISPIGAVVVCEEYYKNQNQAIIKDFNTNQPCVTNAYNFEVAKGHKND